MPDPVDIVRERAFGDRVPSQVEEAAVQLSKLQAKLDAKDAGLPEGRAGLAAKET